MNGIKFRSTQGSEYFYNDNTGVISPVECISDYFGDRLGNIHPNRALDENSIVNYLLNEAYGFRHIILEVSSQCNCRCRYCIFGKHYPFMRRDSNERMSDTTAKKAIDYYMTNYTKVHYRNPNSYPIIGFYGGEPLLNFEVIREAVEYFNRSYSNHVDAFFSLTTNGLLLNDTVQEFLVKNNFSIVVSLDGDKANNDRNRIKRNGDGTFDEVYHNIRRFKETYPTYKKLAVSVVYDFKTDLFAVKDFFDKAKLFAVNVSMAETNNTTFYDTFTEKDRRTFKESYDKFMKVFLSEAKRNKIVKDSFLYSFLGVSFSTFAFHPMIREKRHPFIPYTSTCIPGEKLYVGANGLIHMCERINSKFPIGDVDRGLNYSRIVELAKRYNEGICSNCMTCSITRFCDLCFARVANDREIAKPKDFCSKMLNSVTESLTAFVDLVEINPTFLDDVTVMYYSQILDKVGYIE